MSHAIEPSQSFSVQELLSRKFSALPGNLTPMFGWVKESNTAYTGFALN